MSHLAVPTLAPLEVSGRLERLRARLAGAEVDAVVLTNLTNIRYLTGFSGSAGIVVLDVERAVLTTDGRYRTQSAEQLAASGAAGAVEIVVGGADDQQAAIKALVGDGSRVGLEAADVTWAQATAWAERLGRELVATTGLVEALREVKDAGEIDRMRHAARIADAALGDVLDLLRRSPSTPITEEEFALALDGTMRSLGAESVAFETIVAAGEELGQAPPPPLGAPHRAGRPGGHRLRRHLRGLPLRHDPDLRRRRRAGRGAGDHLRHRAALAGGRRGLGGAGGGRRRRWTPPVAS